MTYVALRANILPVLWSCNPTVCCTNIIRGARLAGPILTLQDQLCNARPATVITVIVPSPLLEKLSDRKKKIEIKNNILSSFFFHVYIFQSFKTILIFIQKKTQVMNGFFFHFFIETFLLCPTYRYFFQTTELVLRFDVMDWSVTVTLSMVWSPSLVDYHLSKSKLVVTLCIIS